MQNDEIEIDLKQLFYVLLEKIWWVIATTVACAVLIGLYTVTLVKPVYSSTSTLYILTQSTSITSLADIQLGTQLTKDYVVLATSRPVVDKVIKDLKLEMTYEEFVDNVTVANPTDTRILSFTVKNHDAYLAKQIADCLADVVSKRVADIMETQTPNVVETGVVSATPKSPSVKKNVIIGGLFGAFASCGAIVVLFLMNDSIKSAEDIERYIGLNTLAVIPLEDGITKKKYNAERRKNDRRKKKMKKAKAKRQE